jgi:hypothetical protein
VNDQRLDSAERSVDRVATTHSAAAQLARCSSASARDNRSSMKVVRASRRKGAGGLLTRFDADVLRHLEVLVWSQLDAQSQRRSHEAPTEIRERFVGPI